MTANATGEAQTGPLRLQFDRFVKLVFRGSSISSDGGLLLHRQLDDALGLTDLASNLTPTREPGITDGIDLPISCASPSSRVSRAMRTSMTPSSRWPRRRYLGRYLPASSR